MAVVAYNFFLERMAEIYSEQKRHKIRTFSVGDNINVRIPRIDRTSTDLQHMPCKV